MIDACLDSVFLSSNVTFEVIVVTSDATYSGRDDCIVRFEEGGPAHKRNVGVRLSSATAIVFLDDDVTISPYCIYHLWDALHDNPGHGMVFAKILNMERRRELDDCGSWLTPTGFLYARSENGIRDYGQYEQPCRILSSKSATCAIKKDAFYSAGGFDAAYYILGEETDLSWRCWLKGWEVWYIPWAHSWHAFGTRLKPKADYYTLERIHYHGCKNYLSLLITNLSMPLLLCILPIHITIWLASALGFTLTGQRDRALHILRGLLYHFKNAKQIASKRRKVQAERQVGDSALMKMIMRWPRLSYYTGRIRRYLSQGLHG